MQVGKKTTEQIRNNWDVSEILSRSEKTSEVSLIQKTLLSPIEDNKLILLQKPQNTSFGFMLYDGQPRCEGGDGVTRHYIKGRKKQ